MESQHQTGASGANSSSDFVRKLYKMLEDPSHEQVVRWGNDGKSFVVLENERFTKSILPAHFKHSNFASFVRQLNKYDFHKVRHSNEESGQSPYGANAWEFKHPEFKINGKDGLENIRRKAPAARKTATATDDVVPPAQMDLVNSQLVAMQQQLQNLTDRYNELSVHHSILLTEVMSVQKSLSSHEHVMQHVVNYLHSADGIIRGVRRGSRPGRASLPGQDGAGMSATHGISPVEESFPSPLQHAAKLLQDASTETIQHQRNLEQLNDLYRQAHGGLNASSPETPVSHHDANVTVLAAPAAPAPAAEPVIDFARIPTDLQDPVYPVGHNNNGIDPMFGDHVHNIPYPLPPTGGDLEHPDPRKAFAEGRKKSTIIDPGWIRAPQILLVEDDPTCRRIGGKFLYSFKCAIDSAFDGMEAVNKMNGGSKYDLVLMDIIMPNLDGVSACHLIRQFDSTPIIAMTSNIRSDDISMYFAHGMNDVLPKPFTKEGLLTMLEKHLSHLKTNPVSDVTPYTHMIPPGSARPSLKDESPSVKSPSTANWQSPAQITGISPKSQGMGDEQQQQQQQQLMTTVSRGGQYTVDPSTSHEAYQYPSPDGGKTMPKSEAHRRQISQISDGVGEEDQINEAKRQRMWAPAPPGAAASGASSRSGRPVGWT